MPKRVPKRHRSFRSRSRGRVCGWAARCLKEGQAKDKEERRWDGRMLGIVKKLDMAIAYSGIGQNELARRIGMSSANFSNRKKRGTFTQEELVAIGEALGAEYVSEFRFKDGYIVK